MARKNDRPPQERYSMTIEEAAGYSLIGENRSYSFKDYNNTKKPTSQEEVRFPANLTTFYKLCT